MICHRRDDIATELGTSSFYAHVLIAFVKRYPRAQHIIIITKGRPRECIFTSELNNRSISKGQTLIEFGSVKLSGWT